MSVILIRRPDSCEIPEGIEVKKGKEDEDKKVIR